MNIANQIIKSLKEFRSYLEGGGKVEDHPGHKAVYLCPRCKKQVNMKDHYAGVCIECGGRNRRL